MSECAEITPLTGRQQFDSKIQVTANEALPEPCWIWTGANDGHDGYGRVRVAGKTQSAHRMVYRHLKGDVPIGLELDHLCFNRACVNPAHLEPVSHTDNVRRSSAFDKKAAQTHCKYGHEYTPGNTSISYGRRSCLTCMRERSRARNAILTTQKVPCDTCGKDFHYTSLKRHQRTVHA